MRSELRSQCHLAPPQLEMCALGNKFFTTYNMSANDCESSMSIDLGSQINFSN